MQTTFVIKSTDSTDRPSIERNQAAVIINQGGQHKRIYCYLEKITRRDVFLIAEPGVNDRAALQNVQASIIKFQEEKRRWVTEACREIDRLVHSAFFGISDEKKVANETDILSFKATAQLPATNLTEPNTQVSTFKKSILFAYIEPDFNTKIKSLTKIQIICLNSLMNDVVENLNVEVSGRFASDVIIKAESILNLYQSAIVQSAALKVLREAKVQEPTLFDENVLFYWNTVI